MKKIESVAYQRTCQISFRFKSGSIVAATLTELNYHKTSLLHVVGNSFRFQPLQRSDLIYSSSNNIYMYIRPDTKDDSINNYPFVCKWDFTCIQGKPHQIISRGAVRWIIRHVASINQRWQKGINLQKQKK